MTDLALSFRLSRGNLGLADLECNDGQIYHVADTMLGGAQSYNRTQTGGPYSDGQVTTARQRQMVVEPVNIDVWGRSTPLGQLSAPQLQANMIALKQAISQSDFTLTVTLDGMVEAYQCEASDCTAVWDGSRWRARLGQLQIQLMRQPQALVGGM